LVISFFFSSRRRHTRFSRDWSSDVCSSDLTNHIGCNQLLVTTNMIGVCESIAYALKAGLDIDKVLESISTGAAGSWSLSNLGPRIIMGDLEPGFYIKHFVKDMNIALTEAEKMQLDLPGLKLSKQIYEVLIDRGYGEKGTQALIKYYDV